MSGSRRTGGIRVALLVVFATVIVAVPTGPAGSREATSVFGQSADVPALQGWSNVTPPVSPPAVGGGMMAFNTLADKFVLFGGSTGEATNSTWVLDLHGTGWTLAHPARSPPARADGMFVYDSAADVFLLFGGWYQTPTGAYLRWGDTWAFYLGNDTWIALRPAASPSARSDSAVAYDYAEDVTLLVGGFSGTAYLGDEWAYTFANDSWWPRPSAVMPSPRADGRMTYDPDTDAFYLYGGNDYSGPNFTYHHLGDTWRYSWSQRWTQLFPAGTPGALDYAVLAADTASGVLLMNGGYGASVVLGDTWAFNTTRAEWGEVITPTSPSPRMAAVGGYDPFANRFVVFSGGDAVSGKDDTWLLNYPPTLEVSADASTTQAPAGAVIDFSGRMIGGTGFLSLATWSFGDGAVANGTHASHAYASPGVYTVVFRVTDDSGLTSATTLQINVGPTGAFWLGVAAVGATMALASTAMVLFLKRRKPSAHARGPDRGASRRDRSPPDGSNKRE